jgi:hypothetical protein
MSREQAIWDALYAASFAVQVNSIGGIGKPQRGTNHQYALASVEARRVADRGLVELGFRQCRDCRGQGVGYDGSTCDRCEGNGSVPS